MIVIVILRSSKKLLNMSESEDEVSDNNDINDKNN